MQWDQITIGQVTTFIATVFGMGVAAAGIVTTVVVFYKRSEKFRIWCQEMVAMPKRIARIECEVSYNSGKSLKDMVRITCNRVEKLEQASHAQMEMIDSDGFTLDDKGEFADVTRGYTRTTGLTAEGSRHGGFFLSISERDRMRVIALWKDSIQNNKTFVAEICFHNTVTNVETEVRLIINPKFDENGQLLSWVGDVRHLHDSVPVDD